MIRVLVDGIIYRLQKTGGISRCFTEKLSRLGRHCDGIQVVMHLPGYCQAKTPRAEWIHVVKDWDLRPRSVFSGLCKDVGKARSRMLHPQVFHSTYYTSPYWPGLKTVVTVHDFIHEKFPAFMSDAQPFIAQKRHVIEDADAIVAVSHSTKDDILTYTNAEEARIVVINHGVSDNFVAVTPAEADIRAFQETYRIGDPYWLYVGRRGDYKNFGTLLRAFVRVAPQTGGYLVAVGGEPMLEPWQVDLVIRKKLEQRIHLLHGIDDDELQEAYSGAAAFIFPSLAEGFGIPLLEAMACGTPIVASDIPVFREVAAAAALYFDPHDDEALADAMLRVLDEPLRQSLARKGNKMVSQFSWDTAAKKLADVYKGLA